MDGRIWRRWIPAAAAAAVLSGLSSPGLAAERGPIRIGYLADLSGIFSQIGKDMTDGFKVFWDEVGHQVAGRKVEVVVEDTETVPAAAVTKARRLVEQERVHTLAGVILTPAAYAIAPYVERHRVPTVYPVNAADDLTQRKPAPWVVRTSWTASQIAHPMADYAYRALGLRRVATIGMDYAFGWENNGGFQRVFEELGGKVVQKIWVPLATPDFGPYLPALRKDIDGVYAIHAGALAQRFLKQWREYGFQGRFVILGAGFLTDETVLKDMGDEALGAITSFIYSGVLDNPANKRLSATFEKKYGRPSSLYVAEGYTGARFYFEAIRAIGGDVEDREKFLQALRKVEVSDDARGPMKMDEMGNPIQNVYIRKVERVGGKLQNSVIHTYPMVSQFWTYRKEDYLKQPVYDRNHPPCRFCE